MLKAVLLQLLLSLPPSKYDTEETPDAREARMGIVAASITTASRELTCYRQDDCKRRWPGSTQELALVLTTIAWHESSFDRNVHAGECKPFQCDPVRKRNGVVVKFRAASLWQIHQNAVVPEPVWNRLAGTDEESTTLAALTAGKLAAMSRNMCQYQHRGRDWRAMTFAAYGTGSLCEKPSAQLRVATLNRFTRKAEQIRALLKQEAA